MTPTPRATTPKDKLADKPLLGFKIQTGDAGKTSAVKSGSAKSGNVKGGGGGPTYT